MDHFTFNIIRNELHAIASRPPPDPKDWAFTPLNEYVFTPDQNDAITPDEWLARGLPAMKAELF